MDIDRQQLQQLVIDVVSTTLPPLLHRIHRQYKPDGSVVTLVDNAMQQALTERLAAHFPDIALLGEEMPADAQQALLDSGQPFWCLDPIDGTSNLAAGLPFYSISLALVINNKTHIGIVYDPNRDEMFCAKEGDGATLNNTPLLAMPADLPMHRTIAFVDFKRLPKAFAARLVRDKPYGSQRNLGSIALELCWLAAGRAHLYLHGDQHLWDYAAADLIVREAGAYSRTLEGTPLQPDSLAGRSSYAAIDQPLFEQWRAYLHALPLHD